MSKLTEVDAAIVKLAYDEGHRQFKSMKSQILARLVERGIHDDSILATAVSRLEIQLDAIENRMQNIDDIILSLQENHTERYR